MVANQELQGNSPDHTTNGRESRLFSRYEIDARIHDEMFGQDGTPHRHCRRLHDALNAMPLDRIATMQDHAARSFLEDGITFSVYGAEGPQERIIPIDLLPRLIDASDWQVIEDGLVQRLQALNKFLGDIYGSARILADGVIPVDLVYGCTQYRVEMRGLTPKHGVYVSVCGSDIIRDTDGFKVLEDNLRSPSGVSYMLANRQAVSASLRTLYRLHSVRPIGHYGALLRKCLAEMAPSGVSDPCIVLLTPGVHNAAYYEHMFLAREMGIELVQGSDLTVHKGFVYMRTTRGPRRVDVVYRRINDEYIDPLVFRPDSRLGVPGLFLAFRLGNVAIANAPGTGVADDKAVYSYVPDMIRYYLGEEPLLPNVETFLCRERKGLEYTLDNLDTLVVKCVGESGGQGMLVGPHSTRDERNSFAKKVRSNPSNYISQPAINFSRSPCLSPEGAVARHVDLRPFILQGNKTRLVPGAFCRVALRAGSLVVNSSQGGGGKDVWVLEN
ncbi:MAG: circularly permuted type 2 ATP-grasp protein [Rhodobacteraceae bacterium]|nr:circularly permuted type 2 ATP-grasp protein [Paracoccaceae bacterium]